MNARWINYIVCGALWAGFTPAPSHADLMTNQRRDQVELDDGTIVECIVVIETPKGVLVLMPGKGDAQNAGQKLIPKEHVKKITRGSDEGRMQGYQTEGETARKVIQGTGFRDTLKVAAKEVGPTAPGPIGPIAPIVQPASTGTGTGPVVLAKPMKLTPTEVIKEYLARYPELKTSAGPLLSDPNRAAQWLEKAITFSPEVRARVEELLGRINQSTVDQPPPSAVVAPGTPAKVRAPAVRGVPAVK